MGLPISEGFVSSNETLKPSCHKENTSERGCFQSLRSLPAQEAEGLESLLILPFLEDSTKRKDLEAYQKQKTACWKEKYQKNTPFDARMKSLETLSEAECF